MAATLPRIVWRSTRQPPVPFFARVRNWLRLDAEKGFSPAALVEASSRIAGTAGAVSAKEDAIGLLQLAAEVEHALMVQYLYAAWSIPVDVVGAGNNEAQFHARQILVGIAVEEMMHLLSVQNLLIALGGPEAMHMGRDQIRSASDHNPLPLALEGLSRGVLAKYIVAEMPAEIADPELRRKTEDLRLLAMQATGGVELNHVGAIYSALQWIFQNDDTPMEPLSLGVDQGYTTGWHLDAGDFSDAAIINAHAATRGPDWHAGTDAHKLAVVTNAEDGLALLRDISEQGEGLGKQHASHFGKFLDLLAGLDAHTFTVTALPVSPYGKYPPPPETAIKSEITDPYTLLWSEWFDVRYNMLWLDFGHALALPRSDKNRRKIREMLFEHMTAGLQGLAGRLTQLPMAEGSPDAAAPTFGLILQQLPERSLMKSAQENLLAMEVSAIAAIRAHPRFVQDPAGGLVVSRFVAPNGFHTKRVKVINQLD